MDQGARYSHLIRQDLPLSTPENTKPRLPQGIRDNVPIGWIRARIAIGVAANGLLIFANDAISRRGSFRG